MTRSLILNIILLLIVCCGIALQRTDFFSFHGSHTAQAEFQVRYAPAEKACSLDITESYEHDVYSENLPAETIASSYLTPPRRVNHRTPAESAFLNIISPPPENVS